MDDYSFNKTLTNRTIVVVIVVMVIAAIHWFRLGSYLHGDWHDYYYSYASDIMIPFAVYFSLSLNEIRFRFLQKWHIKALIVFGIMTFSEIMQYFGIYFFGNTFDGVDIIMFGFGACIALGLDIFLLKKFVPYWNYKL